MQSFTSAILTDQIIKWVIESIDPRATVHSIHQLKGATSSTLHSISLLINQVKKTVVLRQFTNKKWFQEEPDLVLHEARSLLYTAQNGLPAPQLLAYDETGKACGVPVVLMSHLEGKINLHPPDMDIWLNELAKTLVQIHTVSAEGFRWGYSSYMDIKAFEVPSWSNSSQLWKAIITRVKQPPTETKQCFIHRDYHPANVLWHMNKVCGVVDWVNACRGPAGVDVGHCRANLAMLFDVVTSNKFLSAYKKLAGYSFHYDVYWDLISLIDILEEPPKVYRGWIDFGIEGLSDQLMRERIDKYIASLAKLLPA